MISVYFKAFSPLFFLLHTKAGVTFETKAFKVAAARASGCPGARNLLEHEYLMSAPLNEGIPSRYKPSSLCRGPVANAAISCNQLITARSFCGLRSLRLRRGGTDSRVYFCAAPLEKPGIGNCFCVKPVPAGFILTLGMEIPDPIPKPGFGSAWKREVNGWEGFVGSQL